MGIFHTHVVLPLIEPVTYSGLASRLRSIRKFESLSTAQQRAAQHERLQKLLTYAYTTVPFYRSQFNDAGIHPSSIRPGEPIPIAVTAPGRLRERFRAIDAAAPKLGDLQITNRETGIPFKPTPQNLHGLRHRTALNIHLNGWAGFKPGQSIMTIAVTPLDQRTEPNGKLRVLADILMRRLPGPRGPVTDEMLERSRLLFEKRHPRVLCGHPSALAAFAAYMAAHGMRHRPQVVIATAPALDGDDRIFIESVFGSRLYVHYGAGFGTIGAECSEHEGVHLHPWGTYLEFEPVGDTPDGPAYRLIVTDLLNYAQPLIRYDTSDIVTLAEQMCTCGKNFPMIRNVLTPAENGISLGDSAPDHATIGVQVTRMCQNFRAISRVQVLQKADRHLHLRYVVKENGPAETREIQSICNSIDALLRRPMRWTMERVNDIPREISSKLRVREPDGFAEKSPFKSVQHPSTPEFSTSPPLPPEVRAS
ncbi:MAG TPA: hypothetical protein VFN53_05715 [Acidobacteriaceae bacterium]|nr:hypothetical protein [Acidobacteriaceae bacterium]